MSRSFSGRVLVAGLHALRYAERIRHEVSHHNIPLGVVHAPFVHDVFSALKDGTDVTHVVVDPAGWKTYEDLVGISNRAGSLRPRPRFWLAVSGWNPVEIDSIQKLCGWTDGSSNAPVVLGHWMGLHEDWFVPHLLEAANPPASVPVF